jgi:hypothetical protein
MEERRIVGKMNGTAVTNRLQNLFKITCTDHRIIEILGLRPSNRLPVSYYVNGKLRVSTLLSTINSLLLSHIYPTMTSARSCNKADHLF